MITTGEEYFRAAVDAEASGPHMCPVCGQTEFPEAGSYDICPCGWQDDVVQLANPDLGGGANHMSLNETREYWRETGKTVR